MASPLWRTVHVNVVPAQPASRRIGAEQIAGFSVRVRDLSKRFPVRRGWGESLRHPLATRWVTSVDGISFDVRRGEFFGLLGPNGAGKTTLLKMLATFITPDSGSAEIEGIDVVNDAAEARRLVVPVIASERSLYWRLTARENLELFAHLWNVPRHEIAHRVDDVLSVVDLRDTASKLVGQFSSGMMQRLLIARALLADPRVLLLDEPTRSLDPVSARAFRRFLREELAERRQCAVVIATHSAEEAFDLCDRVAVLDRGTLLAVGVASELARELEGNRYLAWTTMPEHSVLRPFVRHDDSVEGAPVALREMKGWAPVLLEIRGGPAAAAELLRELVLQGVPLAALERVPISLAALIERVVRRGREGT